MASEKHSADRSPHSGLQQAVITAVNDKMSAAAISQEASGLSWKIQWGVHRGAALANCTSEWKVGTFQVQRLSRVSVPVTCNGQRGSVVLRVEANAPVWALRNAMSEGEQLRTQDLVLRVQPIRQIADANSASNWVGARMKKTQAAGHALQPQDVERPVVLRKGDKVEIRAQGDGVQVSVAGIATSNGTLGERVTVRNARTGKLVKGKLIAPGVLQAQALASDSSNAQTRTTESGD